MLLGEHNHVELWQMLERLGPKDQQQALRILQETVEAFVRLNNVSRRIVSFMGSARCGSGDKYYQAATRLAHKVADADFAVMTGGGPGIMEAANAGARAQGCDDNIGLNVILPKEQAGNGFQNPQLALRFKYFLTRKLIFLKYTTGGFVLMPGGIGTLDEIGELLVLIQCGLTPKVPVLMYDAWFWSGLEAWMRDRMLSLGYIDPEDMDLFRIVDNEDALVEHIVEHRQATLAGSVIPFRTPA